MTVEFKWLVGGGLVASIALPDAIFEPTGAGSRTLIRADGGNASAPVTSLA